MNVKEYYDQHRKGKNWDIGEGWAGIVLHLCRDIIAIDDTIDVMDIKEKYGGLRFHVGGASEEIYDLIDAAEAKSLKTCELCGETKNVETLRLRGWDKTLCINCRLKELQNE